MTTLTRGALKAILNDGKHPPNPIFTIQQIKTIQNNGSDAATRYKISLNDGESTHTFGILATQKNYLIEENKLKVGSIIRLTEYAPNVLSKDPPKVVIILMNFDILNGNDDAEEDELRQAMHDTRVNNENLEPVVHTNKQSPVKQQSAGISSNKFFKHDTYKQPVNKPTPQPQSSMFSSSANSSINSSGSKICTISSLNPYQNKWTIKARVTNKTNIRTWSNSKGEGKVFSVDFIDQSGEIKASVFTDMCDKYYEMLQVDHVYLISKAQLKTANKQYSTIDNDYEMTFNSETVVELCDDEPDESIPRINVNLIPLSELLNKNAGDLVDVIGIVRSYGDVTTIVTKAQNKELLKREVHIVDSSNCSVSCTLWAKTAEDFDGSDNPVLLLKGAKVNDYGGRQLGVLTSTTIQLNPDIPEAHTLRGWYDQGGNESDIQDISSGGALSGGAGGSGQQASWKVLEQLKEEQLGMGDKPDYFTSTATVVFAKKDNSMYMACPTEGCNKKVVDQNNGTYRCEKCGKDFETFKWRMILALNIADSSESQWVTCFQETGEAILGIKAQELGDFKTQNDSRYDECFSNCVFKEFNFKLRAKMETYNDERRVKVSVVNVDPIDYLAATKRLLQKVKLYATSQSYS